MIIKELICVPDYRELFRHIDEPMRFMIRELRQGRAPAGIMKYTRNGQIP